MSKVVAYMRVSTNTQEVQTQEYELLRYAQQHDMTIDEFFRLEISSRKSMADRKINDLLEMLTDGDTLIVAELSRLGRALSQIVFIVDTLLEKGVTFIAVKQGMHLNGAHDMTAKIQIAMFGLMAEIERDLISERTKAGIARAKANGKNVGRPTNSRSSVLDARQDEISMMLEKGVSKSAIAKMLDVSGPALHYFLKTRNLAV